MYYFSPAHGSSSCDCDPALNDRIIDQLPNLDGFDFFRRLGLDSVGVEAGLETSALGDQNDLDN